MSVQIPQIHTSSSKIQVPKIVRQQLTEIRNKYHCAKDWLQVSQGVFGSWVGGKRNMTNQLIQK